jgi:GDSL-like Lipase/Acylhydrolase family
MMTIPRTAICLIEGDSINDQTLPYISYAGLRATIDSAFAKPSTPGDYRRPVWVNKAVTGQTSTNIASRIAGDLAANAYTHVFGHWGINDVNTGIPLATSQANNIAIKAACASAGCQLIVAGPLCFGEKWPTGQNVNDAAIDALDAAMAAIFVGAGNTYASTRAAIYTVQEPINNLPAPGAASDILTQFVAGSPGNGLHCNAGGAQFYTKLLTPLVTFV